MIIETKSYDSCRFCGNPKLEEVVSYKNYPVFIGCSDKDLDEDELYNFSVSYCSKCETMQQTNLPPLEILYRENRAFGLGGIWQQHYKEYFKFITDRIGERKRILEIGGGNGLMLEFFLDRSDVEIYDVEPNPQYEPNPKINTIKSYLTKDFKLDMDVDVIFSSHLVEHLEDVNEFFEKSSEILAEDGMLFTACPNIIESFKNNHLNCFTTDHFNYFNPKSLSQIAEKYGLYIQDYFQYRDHGMYLCFTKDKSQKKDQDFKDPLSYYKEFESRLNSYIDSLKENVEGNFYLFGAHAFTITFLNHFPKGHEAIYVLDNEPTKQGRRLCGTNLECKSPSILEGVENPNVILYMGAYTDEIGKQLKEINPTVNLFKFSDFK